MFQARGIYNMSHGIGKKEWNGGFYAIIPRETPA